MWQGAKSCWKIHCSSPHQSLELELDVPALLGTAPYRAFNHMDPPGTTDRHASPDHYLDSMAKSSSKMSWFFCLITCASHILTLEWWILDACLISEHNTFPIFNTPMGMSTGPFIPLLLHNWCQYWTLNRCTMRSTVRRSLPTYSEICQFDVSPACCNAMAQ